ncbi:MAG: hypothetical protein ACI9AV_002622 [Sediminicola sp.]|jgi:hypothetical protein
MNQSKIRYVSLQLLYLLSIVLHLHNVVSRPTAKMFFLGTTSPIFVFLK